VQKRLKKRRFSEKWRICVMMGGDRDREAAALSVEQAEERAVRAVKAMLPVNAQWRGPRQMETLLARDAIPQFRVGHATRVQRLHEDLAKFHGRIILSSAAIAPRQQGVSIPEAIRAAKMAVLDHLEYAPVRTIINKPIVNASHAVAA
jgi:protoporphyrinogen oxidase